MGTEDQPGRLSSATLADHFGHGRTLRGSWQLRRESGDVGGLYLWKSQEALTEYAQSELRTSIAEAYQAEAPPRVEVYRVIEPLRD